MPLQNRVDPFGKIIAIPQRGMYTGNRGIIHNDEQQIVKPFVLKAWITCATHYKNFRRQVMTGRQWTELFFYDEATAFAAGHRPCAFCRNKDFKKFKALWLQANAGFYMGPDERMKSIDRYLHNERMMMQKEKQYETALLTALPEGTMVALNNDTTNAYLWYRGKLFLWTKDGYVETATEAAKMEVLVITPASIVHTFRLGYMPVIHPSAAAF